MTDFKKAIEVAEKELKSLYDSPRDIRLEAAVLNEKNNTVEVSFSYILEREDDLEAQSTNNNSVLALTQLLKFNRIYKTFLLDESTLKFKGFKSYKES